MARVDKEVVQITVCLFAGTPSPYLTEPIDGVSTLERLSRYVDALPNVASVSIFATDAVLGVPESWEQIVRPSWDVSGLMIALAERVGGPDDVLLYAFADQPLLNRELTRRMLDRHARYHADYTFADGYPIGLAPELLRGRSLGYLRDLATDIPGPVRRDTIFTVLGKDMNRFDIETELSATDQRLLRLTLAVDCRANLLVCQAIAPGAPESIAQWPDHVESTRGSQRTAPRYVSVQVVEQEVHEVSYSPYALTNKSVLAPGAIMGVDKFESLMEELHRFAPEAVVSISHWGEISLHPAVLKLVDAVLSRPPLRLIVETSGVGWDAEVRDELLGRPGVSIIVGLDTNDAEVYRDVRGEGFSEAVEFADAALAALPDRAFVQAVRCDLTEPTLDAFFAHWSERTPNVIICKYDWFSGRLPDRRVGDLSPLSRFPCWHLERDMTILVDGSVPLCREDIDRGELLGNVFTEGLEAAWHAGGGRFAEHVAGTYRGICERCDEYYTFNF